RPAVRLDRPGGTNRRSRVRPSFGAGRGRDRNRGRVRGAADRALPGVPRGRDRGRLPGRRSLRARTGGFVEFSTAVVDNSMGREVPFLPTVELRCCKLGAEAVVWTQSSGHSHETEFETPGSKDSVQKNYCSEERPWQSPVKPSGIGLPRSATWSGSPIANSTTGPAPVSSSRHFARPPVRG